MQTSGQTIAVKNEWYFQGTDGGTVSELPIEFDFGLLKQHKMGGWEVAAEEEEFFSFTFKVSLHDPDRTKNPDSNTVIIKSWTLTGRWFPKP